MDTDPSRARKRVQWRNETLRRAERDGLEDYAGKFVRRFYMHDVSVAERLGSLTGQMMAQTPVGVAWREHRQGRWTPGVRWCR